MSKSSSDKLSAETVSSAKPSNTDKNSRSREVDRQIRFFNRGILQNRLDRVNGEDVIFHYCSPQTFVSILSNKTLRYSDLSLLNDAEERVWGYREVFLECIDRIRNGRGVKVGVPSISKRALDRLEVVWKTAEEYTQPFVCCFSTDGDSLSQWRAYASDGEGFAIGFKCSGMGPIPASLLKVEYELEEQIDEMMDAISFIANNLNLDDEEVDPLRAINAGIPLTVRSIAFKNPAFRDEKEVRSCHHVMVDRSNGRTKYEAVGGLVFGKMVNGPAIQFQARGAAVVPFLDFPIDRGDQSAEICAVHLGPKCGNSVEEIQLLLNTMGFYDVSIALAGAAYR